MSFQAGTEPYAGPPILLPHSPHPAPQFATSSSALSWHVKATGAMHKSDAFWRDFSSLLLPFPAVHDPFSHLWTIALIFENSVEKSTYLFAIIVIGSLQYTWPFLLSKCEERGRVSVYGRVSE